MNESPGAFRLRVLDSIQPAIDRTRAMLFGPIQLGVWFSFGLLFFLEQLASGGYSMNWNTRGFRQVPPMLDESFDEVIVQIADLLVEYAALLVVLIVAGAVIAVGIRYLACRAETALVRACGVGVPRLGDDWRATRDAAHSLFRLHLLLLAFLFILLVALGGGIVFAASRPNPAPAFFTAIALFIAAILVCALFASLTRSFVTPIMVRDGSGWQAAWARMLPILQANLLAVIGYLLLKALFYVVVSFIGGILGCVTLCVGFLPVISQTILAPLYVFERNWSLVMLHYLGPGFEVFEAHEEAPAEESDAPWAPPHGDGV